MLLDCSLEYEGAAQDLASQFDVPLTALGWPFEIFPSSYREQGEISRCLPTGVPQSQNCSHEQRAKG